MHRVFSTHEIDHPSIISINRTVEQLEENSGEKKELFKELTDLIFQKVRCVAFKSMQQMTEP